MVAAERYQNTGIASDLACNFAIKYRTRTMVCTSLPWIYFQITLSVLFSRTIVLLLDCANETGLVGKNEAVTIAYTRFIARLCERNGTGKLRE